MSTYHYSLRSLRPDVAEHLEHSLESVPHVQSVHVDLGANEVIIEHDGADSQELLAVMRDEGFDPRGA